MDIPTRDYWIKVIGMLQQNWALIEHSNTQAIVYFIDDSGRVFDKLAFASYEEAVSGLAHNGFTRFNEEEDSCKFITLPREPFSESGDESRRIYSSGRYWRR